MLIILLAELFTPFIRTPTHAHTPNTLHPPTHTLHRLDSSVSAYLGRPGDASDDDQSLLCDREPGVIYSKGLFERLKPYLPLCWPGQGDMNSISGCISVMGLRCSQAKEVRGLANVSLILLLELF